MTAKNRKTTAPISSVSADEGQPLQKFNGIISQNHTKRNAKPVASNASDGNIVSGVFALASPPQHPSTGLNFKQLSFEDQYEMQLQEEARHQQQLISEPTYLPTLTMSQLYETVYESKLPIIDNLLYPGTYLFVGAPKVGKSFLMAQIAYHVSTGQALWSYSVNSGTVLYLALEDDYSRLQKRLFRMFGVECTDNLHFATCAKQLGAGLYEQLERFIKEHPDTKLIIIDTLQKVREAGGEKYSYANDYEIIGQLKTFTDEHGICFLLVHHTRKQQADDKFDRISGTNGLLGAADGAFILEKEQRTGDTAVLEVSGRDQPEQKLILKKDMERLTWELERAETELWHLPPDPVLEKVATLLSDESPEWDGSPTDLVAALSLDMKPNQLTRHLNVNTGRLFKDYQIEYLPLRTHDGRKIILKYVQSQRDDA